MTVTSSRPATAACAAARSAARTRTMAGSPAAVARTAVKIVRCTSAPATGRTATRSVAVAISAGSRVTTWPEETSARRISASSVRWRMSGA